MAFLFMDRINHKKQRITCTIASFIFMIGFIIFLLMFFDANNSCYNPTENIYKIYHRLRIIECPCNDYIEKYKQDKKKYINAYIPSECWKYNWADKNTTMTNKYLNINMIRQSLENSKSVYNVPLPSLGSILTNDMPILNVWIGSSDSGILNNMDCFSVDTSLAKSSTDINPDGSGLLIGYVDSSLLPIVGGISGSKICAATGTDHGYKLFTIDNYNITIDNYLSYIDTSMMSATALSILKMKIESAYKNEYVGFSYWETNTDSSIIYPTNTECVMMQWYGIGNNYAQRRCYNYTEDSTTICNEVSISDINCPQTSYSGVAMGNTGGSYECKCFDQKVNTICENGKPPSSPFWDAILQQLRWGFYPTDKLWLNHINKHFLSCSGSDAINVWNLNSKDKSKSFSSARDSIKFTCNYYPNGVPSGLSPPLLDPCKEGQRFLCGKNNIQCKENFFTYEHLSFAAGYDSFGMLNVGYLYTKNIANTPIWGSLSNIQKYNLNQILRYSAYQVVKDIEI